MKLAKTKSAGKSNLTGVKQAIAWAAGGDVLISKTIMICRTCGTPKGTHKHGIVGWCKRFSLAKPGSGAERVAIVQRCLRDDVMPRLLWDIPKPRSDKQKAAVKATINFIADVMEGNEKWIKEHR